jgi:low molecular weight protein-tyrosine phosphatase
VIKRILIVCVGNICRSPMAAALLEHRLSGRVADVAVSSAGIAALVGHAADPIAVELMRRRGLDISRHRARQVTEQLVMDADMVIAMEQGHVKAIESAFPRARGRVHRIGRWGGFDVPDPHRHPAAAFERALELIEVGVDGFDRAFWSR